MDEFDPANLTDDELIAAIISDSIGYASPRHAAFHVRDYRDGETGVHCERGHAIFDGDLLALMESAGRHWLGKSEQDKQRLLAKVQRWAELEDEDRMAGVTLSMMMPVGGL
ncbi:hypothetical protein [Halorubellus litoreus]|uniref:Uncharacterized protein n=1 Tax=Halorubellus litoreus TaxID=755308 RepID=A0ABD5VGZ0_9EURY